MMQRTFDDLPDPPRRTTPKFDAAAGDAAREEAIHRVEKHADDAWKEAALHAVASCARKRPFLTTDDVWAQMVGPDETHEPRAMGAVMRQAQAAGFIQPTFRYEQSLRVACHRRPLRVWQSLVVQP